nr:glycosyltransferase [Halorhodospira halophila]
MEVNTHRLALNLKSRGHHVAVHCALLGRGILGSISRLRRRVFNHNTVTDHYLSYPVTRAWNPETSIGHTITRFQPDVCILQGGVKASAFIKKLTSLSQPFLYYQHNPQPLDKKALDSSHFFIITNSTYTSSFYAADRVLEIIPPIVEPCLYKTETDSSHILFVNPAPHKGLDIALDLAHQRLDIPFLFLRQTREQLRSETLPPNVRLCGPYRDTRKAYGRAGLLLAPSQWDETWGRVVSEAQCTGIPALTSDSGGLPEAVSNGGLCVPRHAPYTDWRCALSKIWDNPAQYQQLSTLSKFNSQRGPCAPGSVIKKMMHTTHFIQKTYKT